MTREMHFSGRSTNLIEDDPYHQATAGTNGYIGRLVLKVCERNLETVTTWAWVVIDLESLVKGHILNFDLVVHCDFLFVCHIEIIEDR